MKTSIYLSLLVRTLNSNFFASTSNELKFMATSFVSHLVVCELEENTLKFL